MGLRNSKIKGNSYDVAPVVSNKDFTYKKHVAASPKVESPAAGLIAAKMENLTTTTPEKETILDPVLETANKLTAAKEQNNAQDPCVPEWVNRENFKKLLLKTQPNIKDIVNFKALPALAEGESYASLMLRIQITANFENGSAKDFCYMLKVPHDTKEISDMTTALNMFVIENLVYTQVIPELEEMYHRAGLQIKFGPNSHRLELPNNDLQYILLDDLNIHSFQNINRLECLNMEHTLSVLRKLAQFHAASACRVAKNGSYPAELSPDMDSETIRNFVQNKFLPLKKPFLDNLRSYDNGEKYYKLMENFFDNLTNVFMRVRKIFPGYFAALNHGDCWSNNILFKYADDGKLEETLFVDFQACNWSSPALDLYYFIISSVQIDFKITKFDYFIRYYHEHLVDYLKLLEYPLNVPNLKDFHIQLTDFGSWATVASFFTLGFILLDTKDGAKMEYLLGDSDECCRFKSCMYENERYRKYINEILPWLYNNGFMEINLTDLDNGIVAADNIEKLQHQNVTEQLESTAESSSNLPEWVDESLFYSIVRSDCENYQKIMEFSICPATNVGDNYSSSLFRVDIDIELTDHTERRLSYMLKVPPYSDEGKAVIAMFDAFEKEELAYMEIIPKLENIYKVKANLDVVFGAKSYKLRPERRTGPTVLLENLKIKNFKNGDRLQGLDMKHTEAVLEKLAQFHAASACCFEVDAKIPEIYKRPMYREETRLERDKMAKSFLNTYLECAKQYDGNEEYIDNVEFYSNDAVDILIKASILDSNKFNVINHGDCWTNNIMFQHDSNGNILNTYFVDFQLVQYSSPCYDLFYFLLSSPMLQLKLENFDYFIRYYHDKLKSNLELLKYAKEIPTLKDLHLDLLDNRVWAFYTVMCVLSTILLDPNDNPSLEKIIGDDDSALSFKKQMFLNKRYRSQVEVILPWLQSRGFLDFSN